MSIQDWPTTERPRERLLAQGAPALSNAELLAVLLGSGSREQNVMELSRHLLNQFNGLGGLLGATPHQLMKVHGIGQAKVATLGAIQEITRRLARERLQNRRIGDPESLVSSRAARDYLCAELGDAEREIFWALFLNSQHQIVASRALAEGTIDSASVYPREVLKACLKYNASAVIFAHNHPSGSLAASSADKAITQQLQQALALVDIRVLDHIIVAGSESSSMAEMGLL